MSTTATATGGINSSPMKAALEKNGFKGCKDDDLEPVFKYLEFCLEQVGAVGLACATVCLGPTSFGLNKGSLNINCLIWQWFEGRNAPPRCGDTQPSGARLASKSKECKATISGALDWSTHRSGRPSFLETLVARRGEASHHSGYETCPILQPSPLSGG